VSNLTVPAGVTTVNPAIDTVAIWAPFTAFGTGGAVAPIGLKTIRIRGIQCFTDYSPLVLTPSVSAFGQLIEGLWHDSAGTSSAVAALPLPNYFLNEVGSSTAVEAQLPKRTLFRRCTLLQLGIGSPTIQNDASPGHHQASESNIWRPFRVKAMRVDADRDFVGHTVCMTNSTAGAITLVIQRLFIVRYSYVF